MEKQEKIRVIITVPNQKVITVQHSICDKEHIYTQCNIKANKMALKELSPNAYKLYMYFDLNQDNYSFALSFLDVHEITGMSDKTYQKSVNELIEKGYLVQKESKNQYIFYDGKINGEYSKVETTQRDGKDLQTDAKDTDDSLSTNYLADQVENTGEILQDTILKNTINNSDAPDTNGAINASLINADALEKLNFNSGLSVFDDNDIKRIMRAAYAEKKDSYDNNELIEYLIKEFTGNNYKCENKQAVSTYANYIVYNNITE